MSTLDAGQRVPAAGAGTGVAGQLVLQVDPVRTRQVPGLVLGPPGRPAEGPADVGQHRAGSAARPAGEAELGDADQRGSRRVGAHGEVSSSSSRSKGSGSDRVARATARVTPAAVVPAAEHLVGDHDGGSPRRARRDVADDHLVALDDHHPVDGPGVVGGPLAAPAQGADLQQLDLVAELDEPLGAGEQPGLEVGHDADGDDVDLQLVDDPGQLVDLHGLVELRLVADQVVDPLAAGQLAHDVVPEVEGRADLDRRPGQPQPARRWSPRRPGPGR